MRELLAIVIAMAMLVIIFTHTDWWEPKKHSTESHVASPSFIKKLRYYGLDNRYSVDENEVVYFFDKKGRRVNVGKWESI